MLRAKIKLALDTTKISLKTEKPSRFLKPQKNLNPLQLANKY